MPRSVQNLKTSDFQVFRGEKSTILTLNTPIAHVLTPDGSYYRETTLTLCSNNKHSKQATTMTGGALCFHTIQKVLQFLKKKEKEKGPHIQKTCKII